MSCQPGKYAGYTLVQSEVCEKISATRQLGILTSKPNQNQLLSLLAKNSLKAVHSHIFTSCFSCIQPKCNFPKHTRYSNFSIPTHHPPQQLQATVGISTWMQILVAALLLPLSAGRDQRPQKTQQHKGGQKSCYSRTAHGKSTYVYTHIYKIVRRTLKYAYVYVIEEKILDGKGNCPKT